jgi:hypothetical protein
MTSSTNRYHDEFDRSADDDDDIEMEEWFEFSDEQQEAIVEQSIRDLDAAYAKMTPAQIYARSRRRGLRGCISARNALRQFRIEIFRTMLRERQVSLLKLRAFRHTGFYPGLA